MLKVVLSPDAGKTDFIGNITVAVSEGRKMGVEEESVKVKFWLAEKDWRCEKTESTVRKGMEWVRKRFDRS